jgi:hypothetical protein
MLLKTNEEMGEAGLAERQVSNIEPSSILVPGYDFYHFYGSISSSVCRCSALHWSISHLILRGTFSSYKWPIEALNEQAAELSVLNVRFEGFLPATG